ncbi:leukocyte elastase inhibitor-like, partial [Uloborus diversus]|uniref:leukocyte elastase inhibitor-like n=1 Tax=Uloborus diversus TaxID=327109 RepID=UPI002409B426
MELQLLFLVFVLLLSDIQASNPDSEEVQSSAEVRPTPGAYTSSDAELVAGIINDFSFKLLEKMNSNFNSAISPISIFLALAMTYLGSGGRTERQLENVLGLDRHDLHGIRLHEDLSKLMSTLPPESSEFKLKAANALVVDKNFKPKSKFVEDLSNFYSIMLDEIDFRNGNVVVDRVNRWVAEQTENAITRVLEKPPDPESGMILLNAIYFSGTWETQFPPNSTAIKPFTLSDGTLIKVPFMSMPKIRLKYFQELTFKHSFVRLPYKGNHISMIIALPDELGTPDFEMSHDRLCRIRSAMKHYEIDVLSIPKFRIEFSRQLNGPLATLGAPDMFDPNAANFSGMREEKDLFVSSINHKVLLEVDEKGSIAAAVTTVSLVRLSLARKLKFIADRPFKFYIVDERNGLILFMGKVTNPSGESTTNTPTKDTIKPSTESAVRPPTRNTANDLSPSDTATTVQPRRRPARISQIRRPYWIDIPNRTMRIFLHY